jgi:hypothetical protein
VTVHTCTLSPSLFSLGKRKKEIPGDTNRIFFFLPPMGERDGKKEEGEPAGGRKIKFEWRGPTLFSPSLSGGEREKRGRGGGEGENKIKSRLSTQRARETAIKLTNENEGQGQGVLPVVIPSFSLALSLGVLGGILYRRELDRDGERMKREQGNNGTTSPMSFLWLLKG